MQISNLTPTRRNDVYITPKIYKRFIYAGIEYSATPLFEATPLTNNQVDKNLTLSGYDVKPLNAELAALLYAQHLSGYDKIDYHEDEKGGYHTVK